MEREDNEKGRIIYKIVDGLVLGYLNRRKYKKAVLGIVNDSLWLKRKNPEMPVMFTPTLHEKSLEDIIELFFHYGRFDIPSDFLYIEQQLRQISNQFTECLVNFSQTNRKKMEDRHNRYLLLQRSRLDETMSSISDRNARLGEPVSTVPPLFQVRNHQIPQQSQASKRKAQEEFVFPPPRAEITTHHRFPPTQMVENTLSTDYEPSGMEDAPDTPHEGTDEHNTSFEAGSSRRKSKPHHVKNDINTLVTLAATKAQQRLNKEVEDDNWDLGDQFDSWVGQLPPIEEFCMERLWEAAEQMEAPATEPCGSFNSVQISQNSQEVEILERPTSPSQPMELDCQPVEDMSVIRGPSRTGGVIPGKKIISPAVSDVCASPMEPSMRSSQGRGHLPSPAFSPPDNHNASMEDLFGREDGEITRSPAKPMERAEETSTKASRKEETPVRQPKFPVEPRKKEDCFKIKSRSSNPSQQRRAPSTSSTSSSITSRVEETPPRVEKERPRVVEGEKERERRREQDRELGKQKEKERIEREKQKERQKEREKLEKAREARKAKEEKERQAKERERKDREQRREPLRDPQRKVDSYASSSTAQRRDSRTQSSSSSVASEYEPEKERDRNRRSPRSPTKEKERDRPESSNSRRNAHSFERRENEKREEQKEERRGSDANSQIRKKEVEKPMRANEKPKEPIKSTKPRTNPLKATDDLLEAIGNKIDRLPPPKVASPRSSQPSPAAVRAKNSDVLSQMFPDAPKFSPSTIKIPKMKLPGPVEIQPTPAPIHVEERENSPEKHVQMSIGFPDPDSKNLVTKSTMSDSRLACLLANVSKKREKMREEGVDLDAFDPERNNDDLRRRSSIEEPSAPLETSDIVENDEPPVKIRRKIDLEVAENVLSQIHGV